MDDILNPWATDNTDVPWPVTDVAADSDEPSTDQHDPSPDQWETARHESRAVPVESLLRHCQHVAQELWPPPDTAVDDSWRSAFDGLPDITALLAQLLPADSTPPPTVPFSATATAKAVNDALKSTRHLPVSAGSPLSRLLASKGSLDWENAIKARQGVVVSDSSHAGWRVLEKEDRLSTTEESKPRRATGGGLLSFWNRRVPPVETHRERSTSPTRSSLEIAKSSPHPPASRAASPSNPSIVPPPPPAPSQTTPAATTSAPSAVSRFLNRFARTKSSQHAALALSSDDLEFLSDIVPSATDPPEEDSNRALDPLTNNPLPPILPPPIPPPNSQSFLSRPPSVLVSDAVSVDPNTPTPSQMQGTNHAPNVPVLAPPPSPTPTASFSLTRSPKDVAPTAAFGLSKSRSISQEPQTSYSPSLPRSSTLPPPSLSIPPLLPPPPASPRTPRTNTFSSVTSAMRSTGNDSHDSDDEFSAFTSFPPVTPAPSPRAGSYPYPGSRSPPSPPPRRTYERTHYPSSSSASSIFSPASVDQLCSTKSSISTSFESFDDFVSPPLVMRREKRTPSPPPLPAKLESRPRQPPRIDPYHTHTPSQSITSPTVHTSLIHSGPSFTNKEHQRTQSLVDQAAARAGMLWPDSPESDAGKARALLPPPSSSFTSPKMSIGEVDFDLLGGGDTFGSGLDVLPMPLGVAGMVPFGIAGGSGEGFGSRSQLVPLPPPSSSSTTPTPVQTFASLDPFTATQPGPLQSVKPRQTGGLSAQDLSFFEGL